MSIYVQVVGMLPQENIEYLDLQKAWKCKYNLAW
jgi:hypothetical protein